MSTFLNTWLSAGSLTRDSAPSRLRPVARQQLSSSCANTHHALLTPSSVYRPGKSRWQSGRHAFKVRVARVEVHGVCLERIVAKVHLGASQQNLGRITTRSISMRRERGGGRGDGGDAFTFLCVDANVGAPPQCRTSPPPPRSLPRNRDVEC